jgi:uncharacterized phage protein gp47/JayE
MTATLDLQSFQVKSADQIQTDYLNTYREELIKAGITNPNVARGTEIWAKARSIAIQVAISTGNIQVMAAALMADSAQGSDLERVARIFGLTLRPAGGSFGAFGFDLTIGTGVLVPTGAQLLDVQGQGYQVTVGGTYLDEQPIPISALSTGASTNLPAGSVLKWVTPPPFASSTVLVVGSGLTGGVDAETIEGLRKRLLAYLRDPPGGGNAAQVNAWAEQASTAVQKGFCFGCSDGPSTCHETVVRAPTSTNKNRDVDATLLTTTIKPYVLGQIPTWVEVTQTTPVNQPVDVSIGLALPASAQAGGPGGGWLNATPFPVVAGSGHADVGTVTDSTHFVVSSDVAPTAGVTVVAWMDPNTWTLRQATVTAFSSAGGSLWNLTIDTPFVGVTTGQWIMPAALNLGVYIAALLSFMGEMGPGECTTIPGLLPRALRSPSPLDDYPSSLNATLLRAIEDTGNEVLDTSFLYRSATSPTIAAAPSSPPSIFVPRKLAFYPAA